LLAIRQHERGWTGRTTRQLSKRENKQASGTAVKQLTGTAQNSLLSHLN